MKAQKKEKYNMNLGLWRLVALKKVWYCSKRVVVVVYQIRENGGVRIGNGVVNANCEVTHARHLEHAALLVRRERARRVCEGCSQACWPLSVVGYCVACFLWCGI